MLIELQKAEKQASRLFAEAIDRGYVVPGQSEKELNTRLYRLANELFGIRTYWHKRIVRAGINTLLPYRENPPNLYLEADDILFFDFGPVFEQWEADFGRTFVLGNDLRKLKLMRDVEIAWHAGKRFIEDNFNRLTGADVYYYTKKLASALGWEHATEHCGHLIGNFPHEKLLGDEISNYLHPGNNIKLAAPDKHGKKRYWIYEIHFIEPVNQIGGFFEQLLDFDSFA
jgi:Xaa-Pro dipeptidase